jgi:hypothetical protein
LSAASRIARSLSSSACCADRLLLPLKQKIEFDQNFVDEPLVVTILWHQSEQVLDAKRPYVQHFFRIPNFLQILAEHCSGFCVDLRWLDSGDCGVDFNWRKGLVWKWNFQINCDFKTHTSKIWIFLIGLLFRLQFTF